MDYLEIETKYSVPNLKLSEFDNFMQKFKAKKVLEVAGYDTYYVHPTLEDRFIRDRTNQSERFITVKVKQHEKHNRIRTEIDIKKTSSVESLKTFFTESKIESNYIFGNESLYKSFSINLDEVLRLALNKGYTENFKIYKHCKIYWLEKVVIVWYKVFNKDIEEMEIFVEIEADPDYLWKTEEEAWQAITEMEKQCSGLKISSQMRKNKSLFELYRKNIV